MIVAFLSQSKCLSYYLPLSMFFLLSVSVSICISLTLHLSLSLYLFLAISVTISASLFLFNFSNLPLISFTDRNIWPLWFLLFYSFLRMLGTRYWVDVIKLQSVRCLRCWERKVKTKTALIAESICVKACDLNNISLLYSYQFIILECLFS